jgi:hypothetical protein
MGLVILLMLYGYFIRPYGGGGEGWYFWYSEQVVPAGMDAQNLLRLGWYLSPLGIGLATAGVCLMLWELDIRRGVILAAGLLFSLLYLWRLQANPAQIYAMRRYVPVVLPFAILAAAYALGWLLRRRRPWATLAVVVLVVFWLAGLAWSGQGFARQVDYQGLVKQLEGLSGQLPGHSVLLFDDQDPVSLGDRIGTPLRFLHGHDAYTLRDPQALDETLFKQTIDGWQADGRAVFWVGEAAGAQALGLTTGLPIEANLDFNLMEHAYDHKPSVVYAAGWKFELFPLE